MDSLPFDVVCSYALPWWHRGPRQITAPDGRRSSEHAIPRNTDAAGRVKSKIQDIDPMEQLETAASELSAPLLRYNLKGKSALADKGDGGYDPGERKLAVRPDSGVLFELKPFFPSPPAFDDPVANRCLRNKDHPLPRPSIRSNSGLPSCGPGEEPESDPPPDSKQALQSASGGRANGNVPVDRPFTPNSFLERSISVWDNDVPASPPLVRRQAPRPHARRALRLPGRRDSPCEKTAAPGFVPVAPDRCNDKPERASADEPACPADEAAAVRLARQKGWFGKLREALKRVAAELGLKAAERTSPRAGREFPQRRPPASSAAGRIRLPKRRWSTGAAAAFRNLQARQTTPPAHVLQLLAMPVPYTVRTLEPDAREGAARGIRR